MLDYKTMISKNWEFFQKIYLEKDKSKAFYQVEW